MISFVLLAVSRDERWQIYVAAALLGSGIGLAFAAMANLIIENVGPEQTGVATGMNTVTRTVGGGFGGAAVGSLLAGSVAANGFPSPGGYTAAFVLCATALGDRRRGRPGDPAAPARGGVRPASRRRPRRFVELRLGGACELVPLSC